MVIAESESIAGLGRKGEDGGNPKLNWDTLEDAEKKLVDAGFDRASFWEQRIAWGDQDAFQLSVFLSVYYVGVIDRDWVDFFRHVNNARYGELCMCMCVLYTEMNPRFSQCGSLNL